MDETDLVERLHAERDAIPTSDPWAGLRRVRGIVRRRRAWRSGATAAVAVVGIGGVAVVVDRDDAPERMVTQTPSTVVTPEPAPTTSAPPSNTEASSATTIADVSNLEPTMGDAVTAERVDGSFESIDAQLTEAVDEVVAGFQIPWKSGFLIGRSSGGPSPARAAYSADGSTWAEVELGQPITQEVASTGERLATFRVGQPTVGSATLTTTTDLETWSEIGLGLEIERDLPPEFRAGWQLVAATINDHGWLVLIEPWTSLDQVEIGARAIGRDPGDFTGGGATYGDDELVIGLRPDDPDEDPVELTLSWAELEERFGRDLVQAARFRSPVEVRSGTWGDDQAASHALPVELDGARPADAIELTDAFVVVSEEYVLTDDGEGITSVEVAVAPTDDAGVDEWLVLDHPGGEPILDAFSLGDDLGVFTRTADGRSQLHRVEVSTQRWTPITVPGLADHARIVRAFGAGAALITVDPAPARSGPTSTTVEQDGLRFTSTFESPTSSYQVVDIETGEIVVAESIDIREMIGSIELAFDHLVGGIDDTTITDPDTGEVLMQFSLAETVTSDADPPVRPELWILATADGDRWFVEPVPAAEVETTTFVMPRVDRSGDRLLVTTEQNQRFVVEL